MASPNEPRKRKPGPGRKFQPGNPGGPGNPQAPMVSRLRAALQGAVTEGDMVAVARALVDAATAGDAACAKLLLDRLLGKVPDALEVSGPEGAPLRVEDQRRAISADTVAQAALILARLHAARDGDPVVPGDAPPGTASVPRG